MFIVTLNSCGRVLITTAQEQTRLEATNGVSTYQRLVIGLIDNLTFDDWISSTIHLSRV